MRNTIRLVSVFPIVGIAVFASSMAHASADMRPHERGEAAPPDDSLLTTEERAQQDWDRLREQVPDLADDSGGDEAVTTVPNAAEVPGARKVCKRFQVRGSHIRRHMCLTVVEVTVQRKGRLRRELRYRYTPLLVR
ncbi:MAG: hypothetical protein AAF184_23685 [Pseudomonadota bacterium]